MKHSLSVLALALSGAVVASAGAYAAQADTSPSAFQTAAAIMGPSMVLTGPGDQRDVIDPPSSIDPGMALDPPQTGAKMPVLHPPGTTPGGRLVLPR
jgi:hypothetical protein